MNAMVDANINPVSVERLYRACLYYQNEDIILVLAYEREILPTIYVSPTDCNRILSLEWHFQLSDSR